jgi:hypothetical protein
MAEKKRYQVIGCDGPDGMNVHHLADFDTFEHAEVYRKSAELMSWKRTAVHDGDSGEIVSSSLPTGLIETSS